MIPVADRRNAVDQSVDDAPQRSVRRSSLLERSDPDDEAILQHVRFELDRVRLDRGCERCRREHELVDAVDGEIEPRAEPTENERDDAGAAKARRNGQVNRVRHVGVVWRSDRAAVAYARGLRAGGLASTTLSPVRDAELRLSTQMSEGLAVVRVVGDFDLSTIEIFEAELEPSLTEGLVVIELSGCTFLDSSALRTLVRAQRRVGEAGGRLVLVAPSQPARRVLDIATLDRFIPVAATLEEAAKSVA